MFYSENKKQYSVLNRRSFFYIYLKFIFIQCSWMETYTIFKLKESDKYRTLSKNNQIDIEIFIH